MNLPVVLYGYGTWSHRPKVRKQIQGAGQVAQDNIWT